jgi:hypothetical protein
MHSHAGAWERVVLQYHPFHSYQLDSPHFQPTRYQPKQHAVALSWTTEAMAGAGCAVAKRLGNSLAIEWVASPDESGHSAIHKAKQNYSSRVIVRKVKMSMPRPASETEPIQGCNVQPANADLGT